jgi:hypothetical protein
MRLLLAGYTRLHTGFVARLDLKNHSKLITIPLCSEVTAGQADFRDRHGCGPVSLSPRKSAKARLIAGDFFFCPVIF